MNGYTIVPAYGRDYKSKKELLIDWNNNKDFRIMDISAGRYDGSYINKADAEIHNLTEMKPCWNQHQDVTIIKKSKDGTWK